MGALLADLQAKGLLGQTLVLHFTGLLPAAFDGDLAQRLAP